jgi:hypothetical protein
MAADAGYAWEKTYDAVRSLATDAQPLSVRLESAWNDGLHLLTIHTLPWPDLRERFEDIEDLFKLDSRTGKPIIRMVSEDERRDVAAKIFDLFVEIRDLDWT